MSAIVGTMEVVQQRCAGLGRIGRRESAGKRQKGHFEHAAIQNGEQEAPGPHDQLDLHQQGPL